MPRGRVRSSPLESLSGSRVLAGAHAAWAVDVRRAPLHTEQEKIFTGVVDTVVVRRDHGGDGGHEDVGSAADGGQREECEGQGIRWDPRQRTSEGSGIGM